VGVNGVHAKLCDQGGGRNGYQNTSPFWYTSHSYYSWTSITLCGDKATPWWLKPAGMYVEVAVWTAGCNLRCPQCQNFTTTYDSKTSPSTPKEAAKVMTDARREFGVNRMAISGGEPTLNRRWLV
jgi:sulfatase maturation enzyme AslB (radical SAM superfamily)